MTQAQTAANATDTKAKGKTNAADKTNAAPKAKGKGGNDGVSPRALRGAPKVTADWSAAQEEAFAKMQAQRDAARALRAQGLGKVLDLLLAGIAPTVFKEAVAAQAAVEENGVIVTEAIPGQEAVTELVASREELLANIEANGNALLTHLSIFFKLDPVLAKAIEGESAPAAQ